MSIFSSQYEHQKHNAEWNDVQWRLGRKPNTCNLLSLCFSMAVKCFVCPFSIHIFLSSMINHHSMLSNGLNYKKRKSDKIFPLQHFGQWTFWLLLTLYVCLTCNSQIYQQIIALKFTTFTLKYFKLQQIQACLFFPQ